ncbi:MAG: signal peptidase II [Erythrobacter sp.]|jgi:signal peptidase II
MTPVLRYRLIGCLAALLVFALDQWSKWYVTGPLGIRDVGDSLQVVSIFDLRFTRNFGVSLGMFEATSPEMRWILVLVTGLIALTVTIWMLRERLLADILALALILGGALGNIRDRFELGYVTDFADLHFGAWRPFLIFNVADAAITIGVLIVLARAVFMRDKDSETETPEAPGAAETI